MNVGSPKILFQQLYVDMNRTSWKFDFMRETRKWDNLLSLSLGQNQNFKYELIVIWGLIVVLRANSMYLYSKCSLYLCLNYFKKEKWKNQTHTFYVLIIHKLWGRDTTIHYILGFPGGASGKEHTCQCRRRKRHGFDPWI